MIKIQNADAIQAIRAGAKLSISEGFPQELTGQALPVMDMTPNFHRFANIVRSVQATTSGTSTLYTTPTDKDFYLTAASLNYEKDVVNDSLLVYLSVVIDGATNNVLRIGKLGTTASKGESSIALSPPIKLDRGSQILIGGSFTAGALNKSGSIIGYTVEP